jgi:hypothetical protein
MPADRPQVVSPFALPARRSSFPARRGRRRWGVSFNTVIFSITERPPVRERGARRNPEIGDAIGLVRWITGVGWLFDAKGQLLTPIIRDLDRLAVEADAVAILSVAQWTLIQLEGL